LTLVINDGIPRRLSSQANFNLVTNDRIRNPLFMQILISTDVLARGFDQANVTLVVNYDIPVSVHPPYEPEYETYLHRIGRSGRFGRKGAAFNFVAGDRDTKNLNKIEEHFQREIKEVSLRFGSETGAGSCWSLRSQRRVEV
jgi:superfamily II DNA/RNA helicase